jgi:hypothetical protein
MRKEKNIQPINNSFDNVVQKVIDSAPKSKAMMIATHKGNFKKDFGFDVDCYVLKDSTAVISQTGIADALGLGEGGGRLPRLVNSKTISKYIGPELQEKLDNPVVFQAITAGQNKRLTTKAYGYDVTILIDVCKAIIDAENNGKSIKAAKQAHVILNASAKAGIRGLVYALAGYDPTRQEIITAFKMYVKVEAREYEKEFSDELYEEWYRLYKYQKPKKNKPWKFKHLTVDQVYYPLAKSSGKIYELTKTAKNSSGSRKERLHQFLSEIGVKALRQHLGKLIGIAQLSSTKEEYEANFKKLFGSPDKQLKLIFDETASPD